MIEMLSENCSIACLCSDWQSTEVMASEDPCVDGHSVDVLAPHALCCMHSTKALALFSVGKSPSRVFFPPL